MLNFPFNVIYCHLCIEAMWENKLENSDKCVWCTKGCATNLKRAEDVFLTG